MYIMGGFDGMKRNDMYRIFLGTPVGDTKLDPKQQNKVALSAPEEQKDFFNNEYFTEMKKGEWIKLKTGG